MEQQHLFLRDGTVSQMAPLKVAMDPENWFERGEYVIRDLADLDVILMRKDPPFDNEFIYSTHLLAMAEAQGTLIVNRTGSLRDFNESCSPPISRSAARRYSVTRRRPAARVPRRAQECHFQTAGRHGWLFHLPHSRRRNQPGVIIETLTAHGTETIMAQKYIPEIKDGDKRILMINGEPAPLCPGTYSDGR